MEYFTSKIEKLMRILTGHYGDPLDFLRKALQRWEGEGKFPEFKFREVTTTETIKLIGKLGNTTSCGLDTIDAMSVKLATTQLTAPIKHLINTSLRNASFANKWKLAHTIPLHKDKDLDRMNPGSYRPVALLSTLSKIVERAAQIQLLDY